jgi:hypothetical protein
VTSVQFAYWLQGVFELGDVKSFDEKQTAMIRNHLAMVFRHDIDPSAGSAAHQVELSDLHEGKPITAAEVEARIKAAVDKLPKPQPSTYGPGPVMRC